MVLPERGGLPETGATRACSRKRRPTSGWLESGGRLMYWFREAPACVCEKAPRPTTSATSTSLSSPGQGGEPPAAEHPASAAAAPACAPLAAAAGPAALGLAP